MPNSEAYLKRRSPKPRRLDVWGDIVLAPLKSRGKFSPRLLMAWITLVFTLWLIRRWITTGPQVLEKVLVQPPSITELCVALLGFVGLLLGLGTLQKIQLGDAAPSPGAIESEAIADKADTATKPPVE